jgi:hypothetical protein
LITLSENEAILENDLNAYLEALERLLFSGNGDMRESVLEFLCFLSDLRLQTRVELAK